MANAEAYLARINYSNNSLQPNLQTLADLCWSHKLAVPYTNHELVNGINLNLDFKEVYKKIVSKQDGAGCHEVNSLFAWLLQQLGYQVSLLSGTVYLKSAKKWMEWGGHPLVLVNLDEHGKYIVDMSSELTQPMKFEVMKPHVEKHGVYRIRSDSREDKAYFIESHKKTILDSHGKLIKQGPAPHGRVDGKCDDECRREKSRHWNASYKFREAPLEDFNIIVSTISSYFQSKGPDPRDLILFQYYGGGYNIMLGNVYLVKQCPDALTEVITKKGKVIDDEDLRTKMQELFGLTFKKNISIFSRNAALKKRGESKLVLPAKL